MFFRVRQKRIPLVEHPEAWVRIVFVSDVGGLNTERVERLAIEASGQNADIVLFGGDYVCDVADAVTELAPLASVRARLGRYFVLGDRDYLDDPMKVRRFFRNLGICDLTNAACSIMKHGRVLECAGVDDAVFGIPTVPSADRSPFPRLLFSHRAFPVEKQAADLVLTHGFTTSRTHLFVVEAGI